MNILIYQKDAGVLDDQIFQQSVGVPLGINCYYSKVP
jgi:hypothetical protein